MAQHTPVQADPKEVVRAQEMWHSVTQFGKYGIIGVAALLILLALIFIDF